MNPNFFITGLAKAATQKASEDYEKSQRENAGSLTPPFFIFLVGLVDMIIFLIVGIVMAFSMASEELGTKVFCYAVDFIMFSLGLALVLYYLNFRAGYKNGIITYRNIFRVTRTYDCREIKTVYCKDRGGVVFLFQNGKKLRFDKEESYFAQLIIRNENLDRHFPGEESTLVKVSLHPLLMVPLWLLDIVLFIVAFLFDLQGVIIPIILLVLCVGGHISYSSYDVNTKILVRSRFGFKSQYDMHHYMARPVKEGGFVMKIEIFDRDGVATRIPLSTEYKNRARMIFELCKIYI